MRAGIKALPGRHDQGSILRTQYYGLDTVQCDKVSKGRKRQR